MLDSFAADFPLLLVALALGLYIAGERRAARLRRRRPPRVAGLARRRARAFYAGLATIVIALAGPVDSYADRLFWVHMIQHVLLLTVAAPLFVLGAPWMSLWRPLPLEFRRGIAGTMARARWATPLRVAGRALGRPRGALIAFTVVLVGWHIPAAYDATLGHVWLHALEHTTFLVFGVLLWSQVIRSPPLRLRLPADQRAAYMLAASASGWAIGIVLALASSPLYPVYAHLANRPGGISALTDQRLAALVMLGPGSVTMLAFVCFETYRRRVSARTVSA